MSRISRRVGAITESATLAVDAKAKALQAAGEDVIGFGAGEPDFPTPAAHRRGRGRRLRRPAQPQVHADAGPARAPGRHRGQDRARLRLSWSSPARSSSPTAASTRSTTRSRPCSTPATRSLPAPYWTTYPEAIKLADGVPVEVFATASGRIPGHGRAARSGAHAAHQGRCCSCRRATRPARSTRRDEVEAIGRWAVEHGIWVLTDEIYEHLTYGGHEFSSMPVLVPELADTCVVLNGVAKTYAMTGLARRVDDRSRRRHRRRDQPPVAPDVERRRRLRSAPRSRR